MPLGNVQYVCWIRPKHLKPLADLLQKSNTYAGIVAKVENPMWICSKSRTHRSETFQQLDLRVRVLLVFKRFRCFLGRSAGSPLQRPYPVLSQNSESPFGFAQKVGPPAWICLKSRQPLVVMPQSSKTLNLCVPHCLLHILKTGVAPSPGGVASHPFGKPCLAHSFVSVVGANRRKLARRPDFGKDKRIPAGGQTVFPSATWCATVGRLIFWVTKKETA